jgi:hypothetical protein
VFWIEATLVGDIQNGNSRACELNVFWIESTKVLNIETSLKQFDEVFSVISKWTEHNNKEFQIKLLVVCSLFKAI